VLSHRVIRHGTADRTRPGCIGLDLDSQQLALHGSGTTWPKRSDKTLGITKKQLSSFGRRIKRKNQKRDRGLAIYFAVMPPTKTTEDTM